MLMDGNGKGGNNRATTTCGRRRTRTSTARSTRTTPSPGWATRSTPNTPGPKLHGGTGDNYLFYDGHVKYMTSSRYTDGSPYYWYIDKSLTN